MTQIDFEFISRLEGGPQLNGYVPDPDGSQSGVTIATGFDLGARNEQDLRNLGITGDLLATLSPYLGKKRQDAVAALAAAPLTITAAQATQIDTAVKSQAAETIRSQYDAAIASDKTPFDQLPSEMQTVIASVAFQYGDLASRTPTFWSHVVDQDWEAAEAELRNFGDSYPTRRKTEASRLRQGIDRLAVLDTDPELSPTLPKSSTQANNGFEEILQGLSRNDLDVLSNLNPQEQEELGRLLENQLISKGPSLEQG